MKSIIGCGLGCVILTVGLLAVILLGIVGCNLGTIQSSVPAAQASCATPPQASGDVLKDCAGNVVVWQGMSQGQTSFNLKSHWDAGKNPISEGFLDQTTVNAMRAWGSTAVRIPISAYECNEDGCAPSGRYLSTLSTVVGYVTGDGMEAILAVFDDAQDGSPYTGGLVHQQDVTFLATLARLYKNNPLVGYDVINEPKYTSVAAWANGGSGFLGVNQAIAVVRNAGATAPIVVQPPTGMSTTACKNSKGQSVDNYAFTSAMLSAITNKTNLVYGNHWYSALASGDATSWNCALTNLAGKLPVFIGEYALLVHQTPHSCPGVTNNNADSKFNAFLNWTLTADGGQRIGLTQWNFKPVQAVSVLAPSYTPTIFNTGSWTCDNGNAADMKAGDGADMRAFYLAHP